jgi:hypothetical protein
VIQLSEFKGHSPRALVVEESCDRNSGPATIMTGDIVVQYVRLSGVTPLFHLNCSLGVKCYEGTVFCQGSYSTGSSHINLGFPTC